MSQLPGSPNLARMQCHYVHSEPRSECALSLSGNHLKDFIPVYSIDQLQRISLTHLPQSKHTWVRKNLPLESFRYLVQRGNMPSGHSIFCLSHRIHHNSTVCFPEHCSNFLVGRFPRGGRLRCSTQPGPSEVASTSECRCESRLRTLRAEKGRC